MVENARKTRSTNIVANGTLLDLRGSRRRVDQIPRSTRGCDRCDFLEDSFAASRDEAHARPNLRRCRRSRRQPRQEDAGRMRKRILFAFVDVVVVVGGGFAITTTTTTIIS